jgi:hypothetical protein
VFFLLKSSGSQILFDHPVLEIKDQTLCAFSGNFMGLLLSFPEVCENMRETHHVTRHNTTIHNTLSTAPQSSISQKELGTLPEDGNVMPKHVGATTHN